MPLPLHVFEPRYRLMLRECLDAGHSFGVVAIREGEETGAAVPHEVGTLAKIVRIDRLGDGRMNLLVTGTTRFKVLKTLEDRPYPSGEVRFLPEDGDDPEQTREITEAAATAFREYSNLLRGLEGADPEAFEPPMEPELLSYLIGASLNVQLPDKQALLALSRADERLGVELRLLRKEILFLKQMVAHQGQGRQASLN